MWRATVLFASICLLVQVKASPDISLEDLLERLVTLEDWKRETEYEVSTLRESVRQQGVTIKNLERELAIQANLTVALRSNKQETHQDTYEHRARTETAEDTGNDGQILSNRIRSSVNQIQVQPSTLSKRAIAGGVAFTAYLDHDLDLGSKQTIKFNRIITNDGNGYNIHTGVFTCPEAGVYLFSLFTRERSDTGASEVWAELMVNSQHVVGAVVETRHAHQDLQGGNTAVIRLNQGDAVWVDSFLNGQRHIKGGSFGATSFTGVYLYA